MKLTMDNIFNKKLYFKFFLMLLFSLSLTSCNAQKKNGGVKKEIVVGEVGNKLEIELTPHLKEVIKNYDLPGLTIGIVKNNQLVYAKAFGEQSVNNNKPMTLQSVFHMASVSKLFVATAIMQLREQGKLRLDDPVVKHLPYFQLNDERYKNITIQQMLSHVSGMPDTDNYEWEKPRYDDKALEDYVKGITGLSLNSKPGEKYAYSNIAYEVLGDLIAKVSGMSFEDYQRTKILEPLNMSNSTFLKDENLPNNWASPHMRFSYNKTWKTYPYNRKHAPSSTLHSNILDMANWAKVNLNKGIFQRNTILQPQSYDLLWKHWTTRGEDRYLGLSWFIGEFERKTLYSHSGGDLGFTTNFVIVPEDNLGVIVLCNVSDAPVSYITGDILKILLNKELTSRKISAFIPVSKSYKKEGLEAAVELWNELLNTSAEQYNFDPNTFAAVFYAMFLDDAEEAKSLSILAKAIFPEEVHNVVVSEATNYQKAFPNNRAAKAILEVFKKE